MKSQLVVINRMQVKKSCKRVIFKLIIWFADTEVKVHL